MKTLLALLSAGVLVIGGAEAWADVSAQGGDVGSAAQKLNTYVCKQANYCENVSQFTVGTHIKGFKLVSGGSANSFCALFDSTTVPTTAATATRNLIDEIYESSANETNLHLWTSPIEIRNGLSISVGNSAGTTSDECVVYY